METIKNPKLSYDEQFPAIVTLYEEYYLPLQEEDKKKQEQQNKNDEGQGEKQAKDNDN
ncbi:MAG: hypothetical protein LBH96_05050 [Candidatus Peribacteria bacterium]|nr:hypothetical protein [Candidatus Peribacteria bacterium]